MIWESSDEGTTHTIGCAANSEGNGERIYVYTGQRLPGFAGDKKLPMVIRRCYFFWRGQREIGVGVGNSGWKVGDDGGGIRGD